MGIFLVISTGLLFLWLVVVLLGHISRSGNGSRRFVENVDIVEGGSVVEQQKSGRELWRRVRVKIPDRPLCYEEQLNLASIRESENPNVQIQGGKRNGKNKYKLD